MAQSKHEYLLADMLPPDHDSLSEMPGGVFENNSFNGLAYEMDATDYYRGQDSESPEAIARDIEDASLKFHY